ncbi:MAG: hypothetical protein ACRDTT_23395, partial [Pseudonocardiaceae bacterium]
MLNSFTNIRLTVLVTHSGIDDDRIEPVDSRIAATSLCTLHTHAERYRTILYWRPIVLGLNDTENWPRLLVVDVEGNGATPPDLVEVAALPVRAGTPDTRNAGAWLIRPPTPVTA